MIKQLIKKYWQTMLTMLLVTITFCLVEWNAISQQQQNEINQISQEKIIVTFNNKAKTNDKLVKRIINNASFSKDEKIKVNVESKSKIQQVLKQNDEKISKNNIGVAYVIDNFKNQSDFNQLYQAFKQAQNDNTEIGLVEKLTSVNTQVDKQIHGMTFYNIAYIAIFVVGVVLLTLSLFIKIKQKIQNYENEILNGNTFNKIVLSNSVWLGIINFAIGAIVLILFGMINMITNNGENIMYLISNTKMFVSVLGISIYTSLIHYLSTKIIFKRKTTW